MRVTEGMRMMTALAGQARATERFYTATKRASSGLRVSTPADDPRAYTAATIKDAGIARLNARRDAASRARGDLDLAESTLAAAGDVMTRAREVALQMVSGDIDAAARGHAAKEVTQLRQSLVALANTRGERGYLFGGTKTATAPFSDAGEFLGDDGVVNVEVAEGALVATNVSGRDAFTAGGGRDILGDLQALAAALAADDTAGLKALLDPLEAGARQILGARTDAGLLSDRLRSASEIANTAASALTRARAADVEADAVAVYSELGDARLAYERSLAVTRQILATGSGSQG